MTNNPPCLDQLHGFDTALIIVDDYFCNRELWKRWMDEWVSFFHCCCCENKELENSQSMWWDGGRHVPSNLTILPLTIPGNLDFYATLLVWLPGTNFAKSLLIPLLCLGAMISENLISYSHDSLMTLLTTVPPWLLLVRYLPIIQYCCMVFNLKIIRPDLLIVLRDSILFHFFPVFVFALIYTHTVQYCLNIHLDDHVMLMWWNIQVFICCKNGLVMTHQ